MQSTTFHRGFCAWPYIRKIAFHDVNSFLTVDAVGFVCGFPICFGTKVGLSDPTLLEGFWFCYMINHFLLYYMLCLCNFHYSLVALIAKE